MFAYGLCISRILSFNCCFHIQEYLDDYTIAKSNLTFSSKMKCKRLYWKTYMRRIKSKKYLEYPGTDISSTFSFTLLHKGFLSTYRRSWMYCLGYCTLSASIHKCTTICSVMVLRVSAYVSILLNGNFRLCLRREYILLEHNQMIREFIMVLITVFH